MLIMKKTILILLLSSSINAQVGIGTTNPNAALEINSSTNGVIVPNVALTSRTLSTPVVNPNGGGTPLNGTLVWNTATTALGTSNDVTPGFYYWDGAIWMSFTGNGSKDWSTTGNSGINGGNTTTAGTNFLGTLDNNNIDFRTNNTYRGRFSSLGEFFVGTLNTTLPGDLMNSVGNATFPWAVNGYTSFAAGGTYGLRQTGSTGTWGAIQGELDSTVPSGSSGVNGVVASNTHNGVRGYKPSGGTGFGGVFYNDLGYSGGVYTVSDDRLKKNIKPLFNGIDKIKKLNFYTYNFKTEEYDVLGGDELHYGLMANELKEILPSLVKTKTINAGNIRSISEDKQPKSIPFDVNTVNYIELIPIAIQAIKEQQVIIENQNERIEKLEKLVDALLKK